MVQHLFFRVWPHLNPTNVYPSFVKRSSYLCFQQEDCLEKVISDTECLFKSREKEYQETIDQIEVRIFCFV